MPLGLLTTPNHPYPPCKAGAVSHLGLAGSDYDGKYLDQTHSSCQSRFSAQHPNDQETGAQIKTYDQHLTLEIVK